MSLFTAKLAANIVLEDSVATSAISDAGDLHRSAVSSCTVANTAVRAVDKASTLLL